MGQKNTTRQDTKGSWPTNYGKIPPQAIELEATVIGALMLEGDKIDDVIDIIPSGECFYNPAHELIYDAIVALYRQGKNFDFITVGEELKKSGHIERVGGNYFIVGLTKDVTSSAHVEEHARIVMEKYIARELIRTSGEVLSEAYDASADVFQLLDKASNFGTNLLDKIITKQYQHVSAPMSTRLLDIAQSKNEAKSIVGVPTGFPNLDKITNGWKKGNLIVLAARPSVGKTAFLLNLAIQAVYADKVGVGIFSLEMEKSELVDRIFANMSDISLDKISNNDLQDYEVERLYKVSSDLANKSIFIDDAPVLTSLQLRAKAKKMVKKDGVGLIIIDYLQLMTGDEQKGGNREQELSKISRELKILAKQLQIPIIALSQMNRLVESRSDNKPKLSDIRECGAIEQDADIVLFLYNNSKEELKKNPYKINERHLMIAKHRGGKLADMCFDFNGPNQRFERERMYSEDAEWTTVSTIVNSASVTTVLSAPKFAEIKATPENMMQVEPEPMSEDDDLPF